MHSETPSNWPGFLHFAGHVLLPVANSAQTRYYVGALCGVCDAQPEWQSSMNLKIPGLRRAIIEIALFSFIINALMLVMPLYLLQVYDRVLSSGRTETLLYLTVICVMAFVCLGIFEAVRSFYAARVANRLDIENLRSAIYAGLASPNASNGDIQPVRDLVTIRRVLSSKLLFVVFDAPFAPLFIVLLYFVHPSLFWLTAVGALLLIALAVLSQMAVAKRNRDGGTQLIGTMAWAESLTRSADSVRSLGMTGPTFERWKSAYIGHVAAMDDVTQRSNALGGVSKVVRLVLQIAILGAGALLVLQNEMTAGMIFAASIISGKALQPVDQLIASWPQLLELYNTIRRTNAAFERADAERKFDPVPDLRGSIQLENVVYRLPQAGVNEAPVIKPTRLAIKPGETVVILGPNAAGKSTLLRLLCGSLVPKLGFVRFDGADIRSFDPDDLGRQIGYVAQRVDLLPGTLFDNIARFAADATAEEVEAAARNANVHEEINSLPNRYQTVVGPAHFIPSGGTMQRLGLARALFRNPKYLFLDEPNANLDQESNRLLIQSLIACKRDGVTIVMVSQREEVLPLSDRIIVLKRGEVTEFENTEVVLKRSRPEMLPAFHRLRGTKPPVAANQSSALQPSQPGTATPPGVTRPDVSPFAGLGPGMRPLNPGTPRSKEAE